MGQVARTGSYSAFSEAFRDFVVAMQACEDPQDGPRDERERALRDLLASGEGPTLEFKSSLRWDCRSEKRSEKLQENTLKTIAALMSFDEGTLLLGVRDDGEPLGLNGDYSTLQKKNQNGFGLLLMDLIAAHLGKRFCQRVELTLQSLGGFEVCRVDVQRSREPAYVGKERRFSIRAGNSSRQLTTEEAVTYAGMHWESSSA